MNEELASRLKKERERLGLSQAEFAKMLGIHRNTLVRYENGIREPDSGFIARAGDSGVDVGYLMSGRKTDAISMHRLGTIRVLPLIAERAGLNSNALLELLDLAAEEEASMWGPTVDLKEPRKLGWVELIDALFEDSELLARVFCEVKRVTHEEGLTVSFNRRARATLLIYRSGRASGGTIDHDFAVEALKLAAD